MINELHKGLQNLKQNQDNMGLILCDILSCIVNNPSQKEKEEMLRKNLIKLIGIDPINIKSEQLSLAQFLSMQTIKQETERIARQQQQQQQQQSSSPKAEIFDITSNAPQQQPLQILNIDTNTEVLRLNDVSMPDLDAELLSNDDIKEETPKKVFLFF